MHCPKKLSNTYWISLYHTANKIKCMLRIQIHIKEKHCLVGIRIALLNSWYIYIIIRVKVTANIVQTTAMQHQHIHLHDDVIKWKHFPRYWPFVRGIHRSPVNSPHKGQWRRALMFSLICVWINGWVNTHEAGDLRRYRAHYDVTVMERDIHAFEWCTSKQHLQNDYNIVFFQSYQ